MQLFQDPSAKPTIVAPRKKKLLKLRKEDGSRRFGMIALAIAVVLIGAASLRSHFVLLAKAPGDMPANAQWLLTGRDANTNMKLGLWVACWTTPTKTADHCRITDQDGAAQFDGDMLPLKAGAPVVEDKDLHIATIDPSTLWVSGVDSKQPVPLLGSYLLKTFFLSNSGSHLTKRDLPSAFGCADAVFQECAFESALLKLKLNNVIP